MLLDFARKEGARAASTSPSSTMISTAHSPMISTAQLADLLNGIHHADAFKLLPKLPSESVDLFLTDPPYGLKYRSNRRKERFNKVRNDDSLEWFPAFIEQAYRILKQDRFAFIFCNWKNYPKLATMAIRQHFLEKNAHFTNAGLVIWNKGHHGSGDLVGGLAPSNEWIICLKKGKPHWPNACGRLPDVLTYPRVSGEYRWHPNQKPIQLLRRIIEHATAPGDIVCDPFAGAFTTAEACLNPKHFVHDEHPRDYLCCEISREWFDRAGLVPTDNQLDLL